MATIENRSRFSVTIKHRADLSRFFPFTKLAQAGAYMDELSKQGFKPKLDQLDEHWLVRIRKTGHKPLQATFESQHEADTFVMKVEEERRRGLFADYTKAHKTTFAELLVRYLQDEAPRHKSHDILAYKIEGWLEDSGEQGVRLLSRHRDALRAAGKKVRKASFKMRKPSTELTWIHKRLSEVTTVDVEEFVSERLELAQPATVDREIDNLKAVFKVALSVWDYNLAKNPMDAVRRPKYFNERDRRLTVDEERRLVQALAQLDRERALESRLEALAEAELEGRSFSSTSARKKVLAETRKRLLPLAEQTCEVIPYLEAFYHFQVMTAARRGETLTLTWDRVDFEAGTAFLPETKNGRARKLSLRRDLLELLEELPRESEIVFQVSVDCLVGDWTRACSRAGLRDLHIHDLRHEGISRVAETGKFSLPELQQFSGHRDVRMLMRYAHLCASRLAKKLDESFKDEEMVRVHRGRRMLNAKASVKLGQLTHSATDVDLGTTSAPAVRHMSKSDIVASATNVIAFPGRMRA